MTSTDTAAMQAGHALNGPGNGMETESVERTGLLRAAQEKAVEAGHAVVQGAGSALEGVRGVAVGKADQARETLAEIGARLAGTLERAAAERPGEAVPSRVLSTVAQGLTRASDGLRERSVADLSDDLRNLARRRPGAFLVGAAVVGFAAGRFLRASARRGRGLSARW